MDNKSQGLAHRFNLAAKGICLNTNSQQRHCNCSLKDLCTGKQRRDECQNQLLNFISLVRKWKQKDPQSYTDYVFTQFSVKQKGNYRRGEEDKYVMPNAQSFHPTPEELNKIPLKMPTLREEGWICLGFWCFLLGVDTDGVQTLRDREMEQNEMDALVRDFINEEAAPSDLETWIESGVMG